MAVVAAGLSAGCAEMKDPEFLNALSKALEEAAKVSASGANTPNAGQPAYRPPAPPSPPVVTSSEPPAPPRPPVITSSEPVYRPPAPPSPPVQATNPYGNPQVPNRSPQASTPGSQTGASCNWLSAAQYVRVVYARQGTRCGTRDSFEIEVQNAANQPIKVLVYLLEQNGKWRKNADGTFSEGVRPGAKVGHYSCHFGGYYKVAAMPASDFRANRCTYPDYHGH